MKEQPEEYTRSISRKYKELLRSGKEYYQKGDTELLRKAFNYAWENYSPDDKYCGQPVLASMLDIAGYLTQKIGLGTASVVVCILHPAFEKKMLTAEDVAQQYGDRVARLAREHLRHLNVDIRHLSLESENFRKLLIRISNDMRTLLLRLAFNLYEMRNYSRLDVGEQEYALKKAFSVFIPFAHRLGLYHIKGELEEAVMKIQHPEAYADISRKLAETTRIQKSFISGFIKRIEDGLEKTGLRFDIKSRYKSVHSVYKKMLAQSVDVSGIYDIFAIRIIIEGDVMDEKAACWQAYSVVSDIYKPNPKRLRDWISAPKASGYESLHTTVETESGRFVEVQIRTRRMDDVAENGLAAHWRYKEKKSIQDEDAWLAGIRERIETADHLELDDEGLVEQNLYADSIFVFTPNGDIQKLPQDASVLDFAFSIHSGLGERCKGGKVNGKMVPLRHKLQNGDRIEIISSKNQKPNKDWLAWVATSKAKNRIRHCLRAEQLMGADMGREILLRKLKNWKIPYADELVEKLLHHYKLKTAAELYFRIASEEIDHIELKHLLSHREEQEQAAPLHKELKPPLPQQFDDQEDVMLVNQNSSNLNYNFAKCCKPIPGDRIIGFVTVNKGISIHRTSCPNVKDMKSRYPYRVIKVDWKSASGKGDYRVSIKLQGLNRHGLINEISEVITHDMRINLLSINIDSDETAMTGQVVVQVYSKDKISELERRLEKVKGITRARRQGNGN